MMGSHGRELAKLISAMAVLLALTYLGAGRQYPVTGRAVAEDSATHGSADNVRGRSPASSPSSGGRLDSAPPVPVGAATPSVVTKPNGRADAVILNMRKDSSPRYAPAPTQTPMPPGTMDRTKRRFASRSGNRATCDRLRSRRDRPTGRAGGDRFDCAELRR